MPGSQVPAGCDGSNTGPPHSAWYWGYCAVYDSGGYVQELGLSLEESRARLGFLQLHNWLDSRWALAAQAAASPAGL